MNEPREFVEAEGVVHLVNSEGGEHTICGDAFDLESDVPGYSWTKTKSRTVYCLRCARLIQLCRNVRIAG